MVSNPSETESLQALTPLAILRLALVLVILIFARLRLASHVLKSGGLCLPARLGRKPRGPKLGQIQDSF